MINIKPGTPGHEGYMAAIGGMNECHYPDDTKQAADWLEGYRQGMGDLSILDDLDMTEK